MAFPGPSVTEKYKGSLKGGNRESFSGEKPGYPALKGYDGGFGGDSGAGNEPVPLSLSRKASGQAPGERSVESGHHFMTVQWIGPALDKHGTAGHLPRRIMSVTFK